ncbi:MAG: DNA gyrase subunit A, partial [Candidatus Pacearchaeota archaeon]|nr:DNA gyrase subunit A [Candidatus Pacearchaeota archaeon]
SRTMKRLWQDNNYRKLFHEKIVAANKKRTTNNTGKLKFINVCKKVLSDFGTLDGELYEQKRNELYTYGRATSWGTGLKKYYDNDPNLVLHELHKNHKVVMVEPLSVREDVYDLTIDKTHNFALAAGVLVHNSVDGDSAAAYRYTEARMSRSGDLMLQDISKGTVDFVDNYDGTRKEPVVLPSPLPQLLLNGTLGIAVGMATNIPSHNLNEVVDATLHLITNPKASTQDLMGFVKGPDFPTGGTIYDKKGILEAYSTGRGPIVMRGTAEVLENDKKRPQIIITEIPYQVNKATLVTQFAKLVTEKKIDGIRDIRDESDKDGMRIVFDLQATAYPQKILNRLYKFSDLQKTFHLNMLALVNGLEPKTLSLAEVLSYFIEHRELVIKRRTAFELARAKEREHILEGLHKCLSKIDEVISIIKKSDGREDAQKKLMVRFKLSEVQANAILDTRLVALAKLEQKRIEDELKEIQIKVKEMEAILNSKVKLRSVFTKELEQLKAEFGDSRKTRTQVQAVGEIAEEDLIPQEETIITLTQGGYIKRINPVAYKIQKRGGKGIMGLKTVSDDIVEHFLSAMTHDAVMFFTDSGKVFQASAYEIPESTRTAKGRGLLNFIEITPQDKVLTIFALGKKDADQGIRNLVMVTKNGVIKQSALEDFRNVRKSGLIAINLRKGDELRGVRKTTGSDEVLLITKKGQSIRFAEKDVRTMGRSAAGIKGISLKKGDEVVVMDVFAKEATQVLVITENGYGKRTEIAEYRVQGRGGSGIKTANVTSKTGEVVYGAVLTGQEEDLIVISRQGHVIRTAIKDIPVISRSTQGVRVMRLEQGDKAATGASL